MNIKSVLLRVGAVAAPLVLTLALGGAQPAAASSTVVVATVPVPTNCGTYNNKVTFVGTDLTNLLTNATGGKILICPGSYTVDDAQIDGAKGLTIMAAVKGFRPNIHANIGTPDAIYIKSSTVTLNGLAFDAHDNTSGGIQMLVVDESSVKVMNSVLFGSQDNDTGIFAINTHDPKVHTLSITNTLVTNYGGFGISAQGPIRLTVSGSTLFGIDNSNPMVGTGTGIFYGVDQGVSASGSVTKSQIGNNNIGIEINECSKISVSRNTFTGFNIGIKIASSEVNRPTSSNKVTGNTMTGVPDNGFGVYVFSEFDPVDQPMLNNVISGNTITSLNAGGFGGGVEFSSPVLALRTMTGTVSGNTVTNFTPGDALVNVNNNAKVTFKGNHVSP